VAAVPYALTRPLARLTGHPDDASTAAVAMLMPVVAALLVGALFALSRRLGAGVRISALVAVGGMAGTYLLPYSTAYYGAPLAALLVVVAVDRSLARKAGTAACGLAGAALVRPQLLPIGAVLVWRAWQDDGPRAAVRATLPLVVGVALTLGYNWVRFADPWQFDPLQGGIDLPDGPIRGIAGLLAHPQKSVLLFAPCVVLLPAALVALRRRSPTASWLLGVTLVEATAVAALWPAWDGGWTWGPRLLLPGVVPAIASLGPWLEDRRGTRMIPTAVGLFAIGFVVSVPGMLVSTRAQLVSHPPDRGPGVVRQYRLIPGAVADTSAHLFDERPDDRTVDVWQVRAARLEGGAGLGGALAATTVLGALAVAAGVRVRRLVGEPTPVPDA
jgi:hypothetical protein